MGKPGFDSMSSLREKVTDYLNKYPVFSRFLKNSGYMFSSSTISILLVAVQAILAARLLGSEKLGLITLIITITTTVNQLFSFRMGEYVIRFFGKARADNDQDQMVSVIKVSAAIEIITSLCAFGFIYLLSSWLAGVWIKNFDQHQASTLIRFFGLVILANMTTETANGVLRITNRFKIQAVLQLLQAIVSFTLITLAFIFQWGFFEILLAYFAGKLVIGTGPTIAALKAMREEFGRGWLFRKTHTTISFKETIQFAVSTNLSATTKLLASESEPLWLGYFLNESAVGLFKVAMSVVNLITIPITPLIQTAFPDITRTVVAKKWLQLRKLLKQITLLAAAWTIPAGIFMVATGKWLVWLYGADFPASYSTFVILLLGYAVTNVFFWNRTLLLAFGKANLPLLVLGTGAAFKIILAFFVIPKFGINGEAALLSGYFTVTTLVLVWIGARVIHESQGHASQQEAA